VDRLDRLGRRPEIDVAGTGSQHGHIPHSQSPRRERAPMEKSRMRNTFEPVSCTKKVKRRWGKLWILRTIHCTVTRLYTIIIKKKILILIYFKAQFVRGLFFLRRMYTVFLPVAIHAARNRLSLLPAAAPVEKETVRTLSNAAASSATLRR
jgi:hypothetical protein